MLLNRILNEISFSVFSLTFILIPSLLVYVCVGVGLCSELSKIYRKDYNAFVQNASKLKKNHSSLVISKIWDVDGLGLILL